MILQSGHSYKFPTNAWLQDSVLSNEQIEAIKYVLDDFTAMNERANAH